MSHARRGMRDVFGEALAESGLEYPELVVVDADVAHPTRAHHFAERFPERFVQMGVAEQNAVSFAAGVAAVGFTPLVNMFACFSSQRAAEQVSVSVAYPRLNVKVTGCYCGLTTPNTGATHQAIQDVATMRAMPNMVVVEPADSIELYQSLRAILSYQGPVYYRVARCDVPDVHTSDYRFEIGRAPVLREGGDITLIGSGIMVSACMEAASLLDREGISAEVINVSTIKPLDEQTVIASAIKTGAAVTAENHSIIGGLGGAVAELLMEKSPGIRFARVGVRDTFGESATFSDLLAKYGLTPDDVAEAARQVLGAGRQNRAADVIPV